jgi:predicted PurR-regulated permease PerM
MLGGVILVQQVEAHGLQPFLLGRWVSVHPLGVIIAIATGVLVGGIPGALVAVPLAAALNAVVHHLSSGAAPSEAPVGDTAEDVGPVEGATGEEGHLEQAPDPHQEATDD